ncbi:MAG TPA: hypothetical protein VLC28_06735 [Flavitalea sp.]|nr:hypothetical protein [Flavitalea sp.]
MKFVSLKPAIAIALISAFLPVTMVSCAKEDNVDGRWKEYPLAANGASGVTGKIRFSENTDRSFNVLVTLNKSVKDTVHLVNIMHGTTTNPGAVAFTLSNIPGTGNLASSETKNIRQMKLPDNSMKNINYDSIIKFTGYVNALYSATRSDSSLAKGNIGTN